MAWQGSPSVGTLTVVSCAVRTARAVGRKEGRFLAPSPSLVTATDRGRTAQGAMSAKRNATEALGENSAAVSRKDAKLDPAATGAAAAEEAAPATAPATEGGPPNADQGALSWQAPLVPTPRACGGSSDQEPTLDPRTNKSHHCQCSDLRTHPHPSSCPKRGVAHHICQPCQQQLACYRVGNPTEGTDLPLRAPAPVSYKLSSRL